MYGCDHLRAWAGDPDFPVSYDHDNGHYSLELLPSVKVAPMYCFLCSNNGKNKYTFHECRCGCLEEWAQDPELPVKYDKSCGEYQLDCGPYKHCWNMLYCPACGGKLPPSRRATLFNRIDEEAMNLILCRIDKLRTLDEFLSILGEPDSRRVCSEDAQIEDCHRYGGDIIKQVLCYRSLSPTFELYIQENRDGEFVFSFVPYENKSDRNGDAASFGT